MDSKGNPKRATESATAQCTVSGNAVSTRKPYQKPVLDHYGDAGEVTKNGLVPSLGDGVIVYS